MDDDFSRNDQSNQRTVEYSDKIKRFTMDDKGNIKSGGNGSVVYAINPKVLIVLGWISAALTAFISPLFAIAGISFGMLANREVKGTGNVVIITTIVLAIINLIFGFILVTMMRRMMPLY